jgi:hypothetical protein
LVAEPVGERLGFVQILEASAVFPEWEEDLSKVDAEIDGLFKRVPALREM